MDLVYLTVIGLLSVAIIVLWYRVYRPLRRLAALAQRITVGDLTALTTECGGVAEIESLRRSMLAMTEHVNRSLDQMRGYTDALIAGQEAERIRIARELHDDTVQTLIGIGQSLDLALTYPEPSASLLITARDSARTAATHLRHLIGDLRPPALEELGLMSALQMLGERLRPLQVNLKPTGNIRRLDPRCELALFRSAQEALGNVARHAAATQVTITVAYQEQRIQMIIQDDGRGFQPDQVGRGHYGLIGIRERVEQLHGQITIDSARGRGTRITIDLPCEPNAAPQDTVRDVVCSMTLAPHQVYGSVE
ncbi:MAG: histidine kinase, partial [Anaerolineae bacterium]|nr:histidine kinase [Anaerolineae bacterium]